MKIIWEAKDIKGGMWVGRENDKTCLNWIYQIGYSPTRENNKERAVISLVDGMILLMTTAELLKFLNDNKMAPLSYKNLLDILAHLRDNE